MLVKSQTNEKYFGSDIIFKFPKGNSFMHSGQLSFQVQAKVCILTEGTVKKDLKQLNQLNSINRWPNDKFNPDISI